MLVKEEAQEAISLSLGSPSYPMRWIHFLPTLGLTPCLDIIQLLEPLKQLILRLSIFRVKNI